MSDNVHHVLDEDHATDDQRRAETSPPPRGHAGTPAVDAGAALPATGAAPMEGVTAADLGRAPAPAPALPVAVNAPTLPASGTDVHEAERVDSPPAPSAAQPTPPTPPHNEVTRACVSAMSSKYGYKAGRVETNAVVRVHAAEDEQPCPFGLPHAQQAYAEALRGQHGGTAFLSCGHPACVGRRAVLRLDGENAKERGKKRACDSPPEEGVEGNKMSKAKVGQEKEKEDEEEEEEEDSSGSGSDGDDEDDEDDASSSEKETQKSDKKKSKKQRKAENSDEKCRVHAVAFIRCTYKVCKACVAGNACARSSATGDVCHARPAAVRKQYAKWVQQERVPKREQYGPREFGDFMKDEEHPWRHDRVGGRSIYCGLYL
jgi:hypothetical protein